MPFLPYFCLSYFHFGQIIALRTIGLCDSMTETSQKEGFFCVNYFDKRIGMIFKMNAKYMYEVHTAYKGKT